MVLFTVHTITTLSGRREEELPENGDSQAQSLTACGKSSLLLGLWWELGDLRLGNQSRPFVSQL